MMNEHIIGIHIGEIGTEIAFSDSEKTFRFPTVLCRDKKEEQWFTGEEAYAKALSGQGVLTDKLLTLFENGGTATIGGTRYEGGILLRQFLKETVGRAIDGAGGTVPDEAVICIRTIREDTAAELAQDLEDAGLRKGHIHVIGCAESFACYVMSQTRDVWNNQVGLFQLTEDTLMYYEMRVQKQGRNLLVFADQEKMDESFNLEILASASGMKLADRILLSCAERVMKKKPFSACFLTGKGFEKYDWAPDFMKYICRRRKVFEDPDLFSKGACIRGMDFCAGEQKQRFVCVCDGRLDTAVTIRIEKDRKELDFPIAAVGDAWYRARCSLRLMPLNASELELQIMPVEPKKQKVVRIPLTFLPQRPPKTTRIDFSASFTDSRTMLVKIEDAGFGELYPKTDARLEQEVRLWD